MTFEFKPCSAWAEFVELVTGVVPRNQRWLAGLPFRSLHVGNNCRDLAIDALLSAVTFIHAPETFALTRERIEYPRPMCLPEVLSSLPKPDVRMRDGNISWGELEIERSPATQ